MRRRLVRTALHLASLLAVALVPVAAASAATGETQRQLSVQLRAGEFKVALGAEEERGKQNVVLIFLRGGEFAEYVVPAEFTESTVKAKFGDLGELDYTFAPKGATAEACLGASGSEVALTGTFTFTGEKNFVHLDAESATGFYSVEPEPGCAKGAGTAKRAATAATASRAAPAQPDGGDGATLSATTLAKTKNGDRAVRGLTVSRGQAAKQASISAVLVEDDRGMGIIRGSKATVAGRSFEWDFGAGTATVDPPAPFTGSGKVVRRADGHKAFVGSLRVPILGAGSVRMAGGDFNATLHRGIPREA